MAKQDIEVHGDETFEDSAEPRVYELGFHLDPGLPSEEVKKAYQAMRELIAKDGTVLVEGEPEKIPLSYTISRQETAGRRDFDSAYFSWIAYEASAKNHANILTAANTDKRIIRFIDLTTTKDAARHSAEIREISLKTPERTKEQEIVSGVELDAALEHAAV